MVGMPCASMYGTSAYATLERMTPASMWTLSFSTSLRALVSAVAGSPSLSSRVTSSLRPPACQPVSCQYSSHPLYMSLPAAAMAPDSGEMKPILMGPWAAASPAKSTTSDAATASLTTRMCASSGLYSAGRDPNSERRAPHIEELHGDRSPVAQSDDAGGQAVLGRPARAEADAAEVRGVRPRVLVSARGVPEVPRARHRLGPVQGPRHAARVRDRLPVVQQGVQGTGALRAGDGRAGRGAAHADQSDQRGGGPEEPHLRDAGGSRVQQADRRGHAPAVPAGAVSAMANLRDLSNVACIVGVDESDEMGTLPHKSQLSLHVEAVTNAVRDAGLKVTDIDGVFTAGQHSPATIGEALGIMPRYVDGTTVGGCSFIIMVGHAVAALHHGLC